MGRIRSKKYDGVYLNHLANGDISYYITYKNESNKKAWLKVGKKSEGITETFCKQKRIETINQISFGEQPTAIKRKAKKNIITLDDIAILYFENMKKKSTSRSIGDRKSKYNKHLKTLHNRDILSIEKTDLIKIQTSLEKLKYAPQTINSIIELFGTIYNYGLKEDLYTRANPSLRVERFEVNNIRNRYLYKDDISLLFDTIKDNKLLTLFVRIALTTGARLESIISIQKKDLDLDNGLINLNDFKSKGTYKGFLTDEIIALFRDAVKELKANDYVININKQQITSRQIQQRLKPILDKLFNKEIDTHDRKNRVVIHTLRHTFASHLAINETPIYTIQKLMNHKDIKMTLRYAKLAPESGKSAVQGLYK